MKENELTIDFVSNETGDLARRRIDGNAFSIRNGHCYFTSDGTDYDIELEDIIQVFPW